MSEKRKKRRGLDAGDIFVFSSIVFIFYGVYRIEPACAFIVVGIILFGLGIAMVRSQPQIRGDDE